MGDMHHVMKSGPFSGAKRLLTVAVRSAAIIGGLAGCFFLWLLAVGVVATAFVVSQLIRRCTWRLTRYVVETLDHRAIGYQGH